MPEHAHLIVYPCRREYDISRIRAAIKEPVSKRAVQFLREHSPDWLARITRQRGAKTRTASGKAAADTTAILFKGKR